MKLSQKITFPKVAETAMLSLAAVTKAFATNPENANSMVLKLDVL